MPAKRRTHVLSDEEKTLMVGVKKRMREAREGALIGRELMAVRLDIDFGTIGRWEREKGALPPLWAVVGYARVTGTPLAQLVAGERPSRDDMQLAVLEALRLEHVAFNERHAMLLERLGVPDGTRKAL